MKIVAETVVKFLLDNVVFCDRMLLYKQNKTPPVNVTVHTSKLQNRQIPKYLIAWSIIFSTLLQNT